MLTINTSHTLATATAQPTSFKELISGVVDKLDILNDPAALLDMLSNLSFFHAAVAVVLGVLCILNGYRWHKWVMIVLAFFGGYLIGLLLSQQMGRSAIIAVSLGLLFAIIAGPMLKVVVAIFAGITGAFIGANVWGAIDTVPAEMSWAGAGMGFILLAMASLIVFRLVIVLSTSIGGAAMVVFGGITLLMHVPDWEEGVRAGLSNHTLMIPLLVLVAAVGGFVLQESRVRAEDGGGGGGGGNAKAA